MEAVQDLTAVSLSDNGLLSNIMKPEGGGPGLSPRFLRRLAGTEAPRSVCHIECRISSLVTRWQLECLPSLSTQTLAKRVEEKSGMSGAP